MCRFTPRIRPCRSEMTSTLAPASCNARIGTVNSTFSKPSAARAAIRRPANRRLLGMSASRRMVLSESGWLLARPPRPYPESRAVPRTGRESVCVTTTRVPVNGFGRNRHGYAPSVAALVDPPNLRSAKADPGLDRPLWTELFFDLVFVVAVGRTTDLLHEDPSAIGALWFGFL